LSTQDRKLEDPRVYQYGILSSRISGTLDAYAETGSVSDDSKGVLEEAIEFLEDIVSARDLFDNSKEGVTAPLEAIEAFDRALDVVMENRDVFEIQTFEELSQLFSSLNETLSSIALPENSSTPTTKDVEKASEFFNQFADLMLAQISIPRSDAKIQLY